MQWLELSVTISQWPGIRQDIHSIMHLARQAVHHALCCINVRGNVCSVYDYWFDFYALTARITFGFGVETANIWHLNQEAGSRCPFLLCERTIKFQISHKIANKLSNLWGAQKLFRIVVNMLCNSSKLNLHYVEEQW